MILRIGELLFEPRQHLSEFVRGSRRAFECCGQISQVLPLELSGRLISPNGFGRLPLIDKPEEELSQMTLALSKRRE